MLTSFSFLDFLSLNGGELGGSVVPLLGVVLSDAGVTSGRFDKFVVDCGAELGVLLGVKFKRCGDLEILFRLGVTLPFLLGVLLLALALLCGFRRLGDFFGLFVLLGVLLLVLFRMPFGLFVKLLVLFALLGVALLDLRSSFLSAARRLASPLHLERFCFVKALSPSDSQTVISYPSR